MSRFRIVDAYKPGYQRVPAGDIAKVAPPGGSGTVGSQVLNQAQADVLNARSIASAPPSGSAVGTTWAASVAAGAITPVSNWEHNIAAGAGVVVAVGFENIYRSTDGLTWSSVLSLPGVFNGCVCFDGTQFVALVNDDSSVYDTYTSPDGQTWTRVDPAPATGRQCDITYGNGRYVVAGGDGSAGYSMFVGTTVANIAPITVPLLGNGNSAVWTVEFINGKFFARVTKDSGVATESIFYSTDGLNWSDAAFVGGRPTGGYYGSFAYGNGVLLHVSNRSVFTSVDGTSWTRNPDVSDVTLWRCVFAGSKFFAVSGDNNIASSTDGLNWGILYASPVGLGFWRDITADPAGTKVFAYSDDGRTLVSPNPA